jgi:hypothetical protein
MMRTCVFEKTVPLFQLQSNNHKTVKEVLVLYTTEVNDAVELCRQCYAF